MKNDKVRTNFFYVIKYLTKTCWTNFKGVFLIGGLISVLSGFSTAAIALCKQLFFDSVGSAVTGTSTTATAFWYGILLGLAMVFVLFLTGIDNVMAKNLTLKLNGVLGIELNRKVSKIDPICYENNEMLDSINKANKGIEGAAAVFASFLSIIAFIIPYFIFMSAYLFNIKPVLVLCICFTFVPSVFGQMLRYKTYSKLEDEVAPLRRKYEYYERCINDREYAKETRLIGGFWFFRSLYQTALALACRKSWDTNKRLELMEIKIRVALLLGYLGTIYLMYAYLVRGEISVGAFAAVFSTVDQLFDFMEIAVNYRVGDIMQGMGTVRNYLNFMRFPERKGEEQELEFKNITLENVSFTYPNASNPSLQNINLEIKEGETIAIVGENGAGKSTIVKLITGLYLPDEGKVYIDGYDTKKVSSHSVYKHISGVFQRFQKYKMKLNENITISQNHIPPAEEQINAALKKIEISLSDRSFTDGLETMLSREFDGVDLSGGQWQKVAIARGFYRAHNMIILDEPTAAIDPIEETRIYNKFAEISKGKTSIIVTHRLGSAKIADKIIVMEGGKITATGTHEELVNNGGIYKDMYEAQAKWYV